MADPLQGVARQKRHAARRHGKAQAVGRKQEARLMAVDVGAFELRGEILRRLGGLQRQDQADLVRQRHRSATKHVGIEDNARVAQRHHRPRRGLQSLAHVVHLGIERAVAADEDRRLGPLGAGRRDGAIPVVRHADQDFRAGIRQRAQGIDVVGRGVGHAVHRGHDTEIAGRTTNDGPRSGRSCQRGARPVHERTHRPPAEPDPYERRGCHVRALRHPQRSAARRPSPPARRGDRNG